MDTITVTIPKQKHCLNGTTASDYVVHYFDDKTPAEYHRLSEEAIAIDPETGNITITLANGQTVSVPPPDPDAEGPVFIRIPDPLS